MIFSNICATIKPGQVADLKEGIAQVLDFAQENEPGYAVFANIDADEKEITFFNVFSDAETMQTHYAQISVIPGFGQIVASMDIIRREIFGDLTPDLQAQAAGENLTHRETTFGMNNRKIVPSENRG